MTTEQHIFPLVAGNWKMNGLKASVLEIEKIKRGATALSGLGCEVLICPPATLLSLAASVTGLSLGAQDCHAASSGAHTGDISAQMLKDIGCGYVIVGHSERRTDHHETNEQVLAKASAALAAGLVPIICIGESEAERERGETLAVVTTQLRGSLPKVSDEQQIVIAYEPVWAIGTGKVPSVGDVAEVHGLIRRELCSLMGEAGAKVRILYGGSVKPENAQQLMAIDDVDGALVGGASLKAEDFLGILRAYSK